MWIQKVLLSMGIVFPHHPLLWWGWMEISTHSHGLEAICGLGEYLYRMHPLNIPYMDNPRSRLTADSDGRPRLIHWHGLKAKAISIYGRNWIFWRSSMVTWPSLAVCPQPSVWSENLMEQHQICDSLFGKPFISFLIKFKMGKTSGFRRKQCLLWPQVSNFTFC